MHRIAAFLKLNKENEKKVLHFKKKVRTRFGKQTYLDHPVHLTLFTLNIKSLSQLKKIYLKQKSKKIARTININLYKSAIFYNDLLTNGHTLYFQVIKNKDLIHYQIKNLVFINKKIKVFKNEKNTFKNIQLKKNYKKYGFPFAADIWIPHVTISSINNISTNHKFLREFLKYKVKLKDKVEYIEFYEIKNNNHFFLFKTKFF